jgi:hypothetical protein
VNDHLLRTIVSRDHLTTSPSPAAAASHAPTALACSYVWTTQTAYFMRTVLSLFQLVTTKLTNNYYEIKEKIKRLASLYLLHQKKVSAINANCRAI